MEQARKPIVYRDLVDIRFADLDMYGHVNSKHYVDLVSTARLNFLNREMKVPIQELAKRGLGFYLVKSTINYRRAIVGLQRVLVTSHVQALREQSILEIPFVISSADEKKAYSDGLLEFAIVDLKTLQKTASPDWMDDLFFEKA